MMPCSSKLTLKKLMTALGFRPFFLSPLWHAFLSLVENEDVSKLQVDQINQPVFHQSLDSMSWEIFFEVSKWKKSGPRSNQVISPSWARIRSNSQKATSHMTHFLQSWRIKKLFPKYNLNADENAWTVRLYGNSHKLRNS